MGYNFEELFPFKVIESAELYSLLEKYPNLFQILKQIANDFELTFSQFESNIIAELKILEVNLIDICISSTNYFQQLLDEIDLFRQNYYHLQEDFDIFIYTNFRKIKE